MGGMWCGITGCQSGNLERHRNERKRLADKGKNEGKREERKEKEGQETPRTGGGNQAMEKLDLLVHDERRCV